MRWPRRTIHDPALAEHLHARARMLDELRAAELFADTDWCQPRLCGHLRPDIEPDTPVDTAADTRPTRIRYALP